MHVNCDQQLGDDGVLLCPAHPTRVPFHGETLLKPFNFLYTAIFNVIGTPVTTVPLGLDQDGLPIGIQVFSFLKTDHLLLCPDSLQKLLLFHRNINNKVILWHLC